MGVAALINLILILIQSVLSAAKAEGITPEAITLLEGAIANILKVQGTPVTFSQLQSLRVKTEW